MYSLHQGGGGISQRVSSSLSPLFPREPRGPRSRTPPHRWSGCTVRDGGRGSVANDVCPFPLCSSPLPPSPSLHARPIFSRPSSRHVTCAACRSPAARPPRPCSLCLCACPHRCPCTPRVLPCPAEPIPSLPGRASPRLPCDKPTRACRATNPRVPTCARGWSLSRPAGRQRASFPRSLHARRAPRGACRRCRSECHRANKFPISG